MIDVEQIRNDQGETVLAISSFVNTDALNVPGLTVEERSNIKSKQFTVVRIKQDDVFNWVETDEDDPEKDPIRISQNKRPVKKQTVAINQKSGRYEQVRLNKYRVMEIIHHMNETNEVQRNEAFSSYEPIKFFCDIETEVLNGFPDINNPVEKILCITICDQFNSATILSTYNLSTADRMRLSQSCNDHFAAKMPGEKFKIKYEYHETESLMLSSFFYVWMPKLDWLGGWNFLKFDWAFLVARAKRIGLTPENCAYPNKKFVTMSLRDKWNKKKKTIIYVPLHKAIIDYMMVYEKWDQSVKLKTSSSLEAVSMELFGVAKQKYPGTLMDFYNRDPYNFMVYNIVDTLLVAMIDRKLGTFKTMASLANEGLVALNDSMYASIIVGMLSYGEYLRKNIVYAGSTFVDRDDLESYDGGWVMDAPSGIYSKIITIDFESLFPCIMSAFNTGLDTFLGLENKTAITNEYGTVLKDHEGFTIYKSSKTYSPVGKPNIIIPIDKNEHITTTYGSVYTKKEDSVMRMVVNKLLNKRVHNKNESGVVEIEILELKRMLKETA